MTIGTAVTLTITTKNTATSAMIKIINPDGTENTAYTAMTDIGDNSWSYQFQSTDLGQTGIYCAIAKAIVGSKTSKSIKRFTLDPEC
jgi:hypothetical protein